MKLRIIAGLRRPSFFLFFFFAEGFRIVIITNGMTEKKIYMYTFKTLYCNLFVVTKHTATRIRCNINRGIESDPVGVSLKYISLSFNRVLYFMCCIRIFQLLIGFIELVLQEYNRLAARAIG